MRVLLSRLARSAPHAAHCGTKCACRRGTAFRGIIAAQHGGATRRGLSSSNAVGSRTRVISGACALASIDPRRADMVALLAESCGGYALRAMRRNAQAQERRHLRRRPVLRNECANVDVAGLSRLPANTFGHAYAQFMRHYKLDANARSPVRHCEGSEYAYAMQRYRETHDFIHVACGLPPTVVGELALKWFEVAQTGMPMCALSSIGGTCFSSLTERQRSRLLLRYIPWAVRTARRAVFLPGVQWEKWMDVDIDILRSKLRIEAAPP